MNIVKKTIKNDLDYLRQISQPVDLENDNYMEWISKLKNYCQNNSVYAMASVQIGIPKRLIYIKNTSSSMSNNEDSSYDEGLVMINPVILREEGHTKFLEGCESCLNFVSVVDRPYLVEVEYYTIDGKKVKKILDGFKATVFSHEYDHLNGILHLDLGSEIMKMSYEEIKQYRQKNPYEVITKEGKYIINKEVRKNLDEILKK